MMKIQSGIVTFFNKLWLWLVDRFQNHKKRILFGCAFLAVELALFFGTGVLAEHEVHFLGGEGAWDVQMEGENAAFYQQFTPAFRKLQSVSFRMDMSRSVHGNGTVTVRIEDAAHNVLFEQGMPFYEVTDSAYTDVAVNLELERKQPYYFVITAETEYEGEGPLISICGTEYALEENRQLETAGAQVLEGQQLVSRYEYEDATTSARIKSAIILSLLTALGVMFGLPDWKYLRRAVGLAILLVAPYLLGVRLEWLNHDAAMYLPFAMYWNIGIMYFLELVVVLLTHSPACAVILTNAALTVLYSANYFMRMYRGTSLRMNDFSAFKTATRVVRDYDLTPNGHLVMAWAILVLFIVWSLQTIVRRTSARNIKKTVISYVVTTVLGLSILWYGGYKLLYTDFLNEVGFLDKTIRGFTYELIYSFDGYLVATCLEVQNSRIVAPKGYSVEKVEEILKDATDAAADLDAAQTYAPEDAPHVFLIMNESFSDLTILDGVELNEDNMPFIRSMEENTIKGYIDSSVFGGGTANSEYEVFTGCSMAFYSVNYYPYNQAVKRPLNSMVSQMEKNGYTTISMHPERPTNWNRNTVYQLYGFDQSLWRDDFPDAEVIHSGVSDEETFKRIIKLYEDREPGEKLFVFDLTMQNHGGYTMHEEPYAIQALNVHNPQVDEYLSLIKISDDAFKDLIEYFEGQDEKVIICMYGDHQPWLSDQLVTADLTFGNEATERILNKYRTPMVIWANYDIEEKDDVDISLNYLGGYLMRTAGLPMSPYFEYLEQLRQEYPIITVNGYVDADGVYNTWSGDNDEFPEYRMLQYNYMFDEDTVEWGF